MFWGNKKSYSGKTILITGGSEGLGFALAQSFLKRKASHIILVARNLDKLNKAQQYLQEFCQVNQQVQLFSADVTDKNGITSVFEEVHKILGAIDVVVCNAGFSVPGRFLEQDAEVFEKQMNVNYFGTINTVKACLPDMIKNHNGELVFISSSAALIGLSGYSSYSPTKAAIRMYSDCLRNELQGSGVNVCIAYPPDMDTAGYQQEKESIPGELEAMMKFAGAKVFQTWEVAECMVKGMERGGYHLPSPDFLQNLLAILMTGVTPRQYNIFLEMFVSCLLPIVAVFYRTQFDRIVRKFNKSSKDDYLFVGFTTKKRNCN